MDERAYSDYHLIQKITDWDRIRQEILSEPANLSPRVKATKRRHGLSYRLSRVLLPLVVKVSGAKGGGF